jgi:hypothetical protein
VGSPCDTLRVGTGPGAVVRPYYSDLNPLAASPALGAGVLAAAVPHALGEDIGPSKVGELASDLRGFDEDDAKGVHGCFVVDAVSMARLAPLRKRGCDTSAVGTGPGRVVRLYYPYL